MWIQRSHPKELQQERGPIGGGDPCSPSELRKEVCQNFATSLLLPLPVGIHQVVSFEGSCLLKFDVVTIWFVLWRDLSWKGNFVYGQWTDEFAVMRHALCGMLNLAFHKLTFGKKYFRCHRRFQVDIFCPETIYCMSELFLYSCSQYQGKHLDAHHICTLCTLCSTMWPCK